MYAILKVRSRRDDNKSLYQWHLNDDNGIFTTLDLVELTNEVQKVASSTALDDIQIISTVDVSLETLVTDNGTCGHSSMTVEEFDELYTNVISDVKEGE